jgi:hypothetical protein
MQNKSNSNHAARLAIWLGAAFCLCCASLMLSAAARTDNPPPPDAIGAIEGDSIAVTGPMSVEAIHGQVKTILRSGSDIRVKSGNAHIELVEGGQISICGPAHLSVLKSGTALTVALDTGTIHIHVEGDPVVTVYTPQILARPILIGDGAEDLLVGFESPGVMCVRADRGAVRMEQQLTGQSIVVPQTGDITLTNGQLESIKNSSGHCVCEMELTSNQAGPEISRLATTEEIHRNLTDAKPNLPAPNSKKLAPDEEPIYHVVVPPLVYDAKLKVQPEIDPKMIVLVRRVRVRPTLIFQGRVEGEKPAVAARVAPASTATVATAATPAPAKPQTPPASDSMMDRAKKLWRKIWPPTS